MRRCSPRPLPPLLPQVPQYLSSIMVNDLCRSQVLTAALSHPIRFPSSLLYPSFCTCAHLTAFGVCSRSAFWLCLQPQGPKAITLRRFYPPGACCCRIYVCLLSVVVIFYGVCRDTFLLWWLGEAFLTLFALEIEFHFMNLTILRLLF